MFSCEFCKLSKNTFFTEHLWPTASVNGCVSHTSGLKRFAQRGCLYLEERTEIAISFHGGRAMTAVLRTHEIKFSELRDRYTRIFNMMPNFNLFRSHTRLHIHTLKGVLRRNIEHFLIKTIYKKWGIPEMKQLKNTFFFLFPTVCVFDFCKNMNSRLYILFLLDKSMK